MNGEGQASKGQSASRRLKDDVKDGKTTSGASLQNTPPLQTLVGVRVVASLLGHSRIETLCSRASTHVGQWGFDMGKVARRPRRKHPEENAPSARKKGIG